MDIVGIDLGTFSILVSVPDSQGNPVILANDVGEPSLRSVVYFDGDSTLVGTEALNAGYVDPSRCVRNAKRHIGTDDVLFEEDGRKYTAADVAAVQLAEVKKIVEQRTGEFVSKAAIAVPANFNQRQREEVIEAARSVGIEVVLTPNEPTAAALGTKVHQRGDGTYLIVDIGGGTTDISALRISGNDSVVLASSGVPQLGGEDWNKRLFDRVFGRCEREFGFRPNEKEHPVLVQDIATRVEQAKVALTTRNSATVMVHHDGKVLNATIGREEFEAETRDLVDRVMQKVEETVEEAGVSFAEFREIVPIGGPSQMPMVRRAIEKLCGKPPTTHTEPITAVALGTMILGRMEVEKTKPFTVGGRALPALDPRLREITTHPIGVCTLDEREEFVNSVILEKGRPIPASYTRSFRLAEPGQAAAFIRVLQGRDGDAAETCHEIGTFELEDLTPQYDRPHRIDLRFDLDKNGILRAQAVDELSGKSADLEVNYKNERGKESVSS